MTTPLPIECADDVFALGPIPSTFPGTSVRRLTSRMANLADDARAATLLYGRLTTDSDNIRRAYKEEMWKAAGSAYGYLQAISDLTDMDEQTRDTWIKYIRGHDMPTPDPASLVPIPTGREGRH